MIHEDTPIGTVVTFAGRCVETVSMPYRPLGCAEWAVKVRHCDNPGGRCFPIPCFMARIAVRPGQQKLF